MKKTILFSIVSLFLIMDKITAQHIKTEEDSLAYSLGVMLASSLKEEGYTDLNLDLFKAGFSQVMKSEPTLMSQSECESHVKAGNQRVKMRKYEVNKKLGEEFLATNKNKPGVTTTASGLQYEVLKQGDGPKPSATDKVNVHYHGTLINGGVFDSSVDRGEPISFGLNQVIRGWTEGVQLMPVGSKYRFYIPSDLAYGSRPAGAKILPYSTLIFEVELLGIEK